MPPRILPASWVLTSRYPLANSQELTMPKMQAMRSQVRP
jgi:hypothetical protein